jgi:catechol 2,3-dioxygenase-like lactoylglutathione lyase family enzyme
MSSALQVEHVDFVSLLVQDIPRAKRFYTETLGLELETDSEHDLEVRAGQVTIDLFNPASQGQPFAPSLGGVALRVPDVAAARQELEAKGVEFEGPIVETSVCRMTFFHDPDGNSLILHRRYDA